MVDHDIRQDADPVFLRLGAKRDKLLLRAEGGAVADGKTQRLVEGPPGGAAAFRLLHRHDENILEPGVLNVFQIDHDLVIGPVEGVQRQTVRSVFGQGVGITVREICGSLGRGVSFRTAAEQRKAQRQHETKQIFHLVIPS